MHLPFSLTTPDPTLNYTLLSEIDRGGMGIVYLAEKSGTSEQLACKLIKINDPDEKNLLEAEMEIASKLSHPHVIETFSYGEIEVNGDQYYYSIMDLVRQGSLHKLIQGKKKKSELLDLTLALMYMKQISEGLKYAHKFIVHRDLKPLYPFRWVI